MEYEERLVMKPVAEKLNKLILLLAYNLVKDMTIAEGAPILNRLGLCNKEISAIFDIAVGGKDNEES